MRFPHSALPLCVGFLLAGCALVARPHARGNSALQAGDYLRLGQRLAKLGLPAVFVLEGGYAAAELGVNAVNVIDGFEQR